MVRTTTPSEPRNPLTLLSSLFATHKLAPSKAMPLGSLPIAKDLVGGVKLRCWWATGAEFPRPLGRYKFCPSSCNAWRVKTKRSNNAATDGRTCIFLMIPRLNSTLLHKHREGLRHQTRVRSSLTGNVFLRGHHIPITENDCFFHSTRQNV
jgi:hypothetical protein